MATSYETDLIDRYVALRARESFWAYRLYMNEDLRVGWWEREVAAKLELFYRRMISNERPIEVFEAPPQHGKSTTVVDFISWMIGRHPDTRTIYASFSDRLGIRANLQLQRMFSGAKYQRVFPEVVIPGRGQSMATRDRKLIELVGRKGSFRNTTVRGPVTGESLDFGVVDDPLKGRLEANSPTFREGTWNWFTDDFFTRFADHAGLLIILTRWHVADPVGLLIENGANVKVHKYPALATEDGKHRKEGEPLSPQLKSKEFLLERKKLLTKSSWESLYQQSPFVADGDMFPISRFVMEPYAPPASEVVRRVRYWDKAGTKDGDGAETSGTLLWELRDGRFAVIHVAHGRWSALEREAHIKTWAQADGYDTTIYVEQEPGSGGKESAEFTIRNLAGFSIFADRPTGDKVIRAEPYAAQVQGGNVILVAGEWNRAFLEEHQQFPNGALKDMVDSTSGAFNKLVEDTYNIAALGAEL